MDVPDLGGMQWLFALLAGICVGISKSGFAGVSLVTVTLMAQVFDPRESTGALLPLLIFGDVMAVAVYRRHAVWRHVLRMLPPTVVGVVGGYFLMRALPGARFGPVLGLVVFSMVVVHVVVRMRGGAGKPVPDGPLFAWGMGIWGGLATMLYLLALRLPKYELVGTSAWFFLIINVFKVPFSAGLGLITGSSLVLDALLVPLVVVGTFLGRRMVAHVPQHLFEVILLASAVLASARLSGLI
jgi:uncharacterized membrane protein YfcA